MSLVLERPDAGPRATEDAKSKLKVIDCDIHPGLNSTRELFPYISCGASCCRNARSFPIFCTFSK